MAEAQAVWSRVFDPARAGQRPARTRVLSLRRAAPNPDNLPTILTRRAAARRGDASDYSRQRHGRRAGRHRGVGGAGHYSAGRAHSVWAWCRSTSAFAWRESSTPASSTTTLPGRSSAFLTRNSLFGLGRRDLGHPIQGRRHLPGRRQWRAQLEQAAGQATASWPPVGWSRTSPCSAPCGWSAW